MQSHEANAFFAEHSKMLTAFNITHFLLTKKWVLVEDKLFILDPIAGHIPLPDEINRY